MKRIRSWDDLRAYGIDALTGEACGLGYRILCDVTAKGKATIEKALGVKEAGLHEAWNRGGEGVAAHVGSVLLPPEMLTCLGIFALLEAGCTEVLLPTGESPIGLEVVDGVEAGQAVVDEYGPCRRFAYRGTAGDRNVHQMSGRVV